MGRPVFSTLSLAGAIAAADFIFIGRKHGSAVVVDEVLKATRPLTAGETVMVARAGTKRHAKLADEYKGRPMPSYPATRYERPLREPPEGEPHIYLVTASLELVADGSIEQLAAAAEIRALLLSL